MSAATATTTAATAATAAAAAAAAASNSIADLIASIDIAPTQRQDVQIPEALFPPLSAANEAKANVQNDLTGGIRRVLVPQHRMTPLRTNWLDIYTPLVEHLQLQVRFNRKAKCVEMKTSPTTRDPGALQKGADFVRAFILGFHVADCTVLLRLDDLFLDSFDIKDVRTLNGDHFSRAVGRIAGRNGATKNIIENATRTRIVLADTRVHILGSYNNLRIARDAVVSLVRGSPPGKIAVQMRNVAARMKERF